MPIFSQLLLFTEPTGTQPQSFCFPQLYLPRQPARSRIRLPFGCGSDRCQPRCPTRCSSSVTASISIPAPPLDEPPTCLAFTFYVAAPILQFCLGHFFLTKLYITSLCALRTDRHISSISGDKETKAPVIRKPIVGADLQGRPDHSPPARPRSFPERRRRNMALGTIKFVSLSPTLPSSPLLGLPLHRETRLHCVITPHGLP